MTISDFIVGHFEAGLFTQENVNIALLSWGVTDPTIDYTEVGQREKDLALSNLYMTLSAMTSGGGMRITKGNRTVTSKTYNFGVNDRKKFRLDAMSLRRKWGVYDDSITGQSGSHKQKSTVKFSKSVEYVQKRRRF